MYGPYITAPEEDYATFGHKLSYQKRKLIYQLTGVGVLRMSLQVFRTLCFEIISPAAVPATEAR